MAERFLLHVASVVAGGGGVLVAYMTGRHSGGWWAGFEAGLTGTGWPGGPVLGIVGAFGLIGLSVALGIAAERKGPPR